MTKSILSFLSIVLTVGLLLSMKFSSKVGPDEFIETYKSSISSFKKTNTDIDVEYTITNIPKEIKFISQYRQKIISSEELQQALNKKSSDLDFLLQVEIPRNGNQEFLKYEIDTFDYNQRLAYYAFDFSKDIEIIFDTGETTKPSAFIFERSFGLSPKGTMTFSFEIPKKAKDFEIIIDDQIYGSSKQKFEFVLKELKSLPRLKKISTWKSVK